MFWLFSDFLSTKSVHCLRILEFNKYVHDNKYPLSLDEGLWDILIKDIPKEVTSYTLDLDMLREGVTYDFRVIGVNDYGYGSPSAPSPSVSGE